MAATAGVNVGAITAWLRERVPACEPPLRVTPIAGGRSNLTYRIADTAGRAWVLRRPPLHSVLPTAHDVLRECRAMTALQPTAVPVPRVSATTTACCSARPAA
jgi:aminoglycoside phosphotransferase (APT) family kinase protein